MDCIAHQTPLSIDCIAQQTPLPMSSPPGKNTGMGCHALLQGIFPTQWLNPHLLHLLCWQVNSMPLSHLGSPSYQWSSAQTSTMLRTTRCLIMVRANIYWEFVKTCLAQRALYNINSFNAHNAMKQVIWLPPPFHRWKKLKLWALKLHVQNHAGVNCRVWTVTTLSDLYPVRAYILFQFLIY